MTVDWFDLVFFFHEKLQWPSNCEFLGVYSNIVIDIIISKADKVLDLVDRT